MYCRENSLTSLRATGVAFGGYYISYSTYYAGCDCSDNSLDATALNQFYTDLEPVNDGLLIVSDNPGTASDDPTIATAKGYTVLGS
jgi:hypothetical protein